MTSYAIRVDPTFEPENNEAVASKFRVLHVLEATLGGTLRYLENMMVALTPSPIIFGLAYASRRADHRLTPTLDRALQAGWMLFPVDMRREISPASDFACACTLASAIRQFRPSILHCHSSKAGALGRIASLAMWPRPQVIYSPHALAPEAHYLRVERSFKWLTDRFLAVSDSERSQLLSLGFGSPKSVGVVYPTIDTDAFSPRDQLLARKTLRLPDLPIVLGVGRMTPQKRPLDLLLTLELVRMAVPNAIAVWVGDGEERALFEQTAKAVGLAPHVHITGWVKDVRPYIGAASVVLSTSAFESFGYSVAEALAMERPVVATRICGTTDVLPSMLGDVFFETGDVQEAARKCVAFLQSADAADKVAIEGRKFVISAFSVKRMRETLLRFYFETNNSAGVWRK